MRDVCFKPQSDKYDILNMQIINYLRPFVLCVLKGDMTENVRTHLA